MTKEHLKKLVAVNQYTHIAITPQDPEMIKPYAERAAVTMAILGNLMGDVDVESATYGVEFTVIKGNQVEEKWKDEWENEKFRFLGFQILEIFR